MRTFKLTLQYLGIRYCGWQIQPNGPTIQAVLQGVLSQTLGENITVIAAGRTDSGVHALAQVAHFRSVTKMSLETLQRALNAQLPGDISVLKLEEVSEEFHALYWAKLKTYSYLILQSQRRFPMLQPYVWRKWGELDWKAVEKCLKLVEGEHDFRSFCAADSQAKTTVRELAQVKLQKVALNDFGNSLLDLFGLSSMVPVLVDESGSYPKIETDQIMVLSFQGKGFLKHMVRNLVGTLMEVAQGKTNIEQFKEILAAKDRRQAGITAPAQGLFLVKVEY